MGWPRGDAANARPGALVWGEVEVYGFRGWGIMKRPVKKVRGDSRISYSAIQCELLGVTAAEDWLKDCARSVDSVCIRDGPRRTLWSLPSPIGGTVR